MTEMNPTAALTESQVANGNCCCIIVVLLCLGDESEFSAVMMMLIARPHTPIDLPWIRREMRGLHVLQYNIVYAQIRVMIIR